MSKEGKDIETETNSGANDPENDNDNYLLLSGIQHFLFCQRQWALIHVAQAWQENILTAEGQIVHKIVDQPFLKEKRKNLLISRAMPISSKLLGLTGILDLVEFHQAENGVRLIGRDGKWQVVIVEYKRGKKHDHNAERVQLMAQGICLEEDFQTHLSHGYLYHHETDSREKVEFSDELRALTIETAKQMHACYRQQYIPKPEFLPHCRRCSLFDECQPKLTQGNKSIEHYIYGAEL